MEREQHIDFLLKESDDFQKRKRQTQDLQEAYLRFAHTGLKKDYDALYEKTESYCVPWVQSHANTIPDFPKDMVEDILQDARMALWTSLQKSREIPEEFNYPPFAMSLYKYKLIDAARRTARKKSVFDSRPLDTHRDGDDTISAIDPKVEDKYWIDEVRAAYVGVFRAYCQGIVSLPDSPPGPLALCYARVFPHLTSSIPDGKAVSPTWAVKKMQGKTVKALASESETTLQNNVLKTLCWSRRFYAELCSDFSAEGTSGVLGEILYTDAFPKSKIQYWADYLHIKAGIAASRIISDDKALRKLALTHIVESKIVLQLKLERKEDLER